LDAAVVLLKNVADLFELWVLEIIIGYGGVFRGGTNINKLTDSGLSPWMGVVLMWLVV
jgi:hypothetical protein